MPDSFTFISFGTSKLLYSGISDMTVIPAVVNRQDSYDVRLNPFGDDDVDDDESVESDVQPASTLTSTSAVTTIDTAAVPAVAATVTPPSRVPLPSTKISATTAYCYFLFVFLLFVF